MVEQADWALLELVVRQLLGCTRAMTAVRLGLVAAHMAQVAVVAALVGMELVEQVETELPREPMELLAIMVG